MTGWREEGREKEREREEAEERERERRVGGGRRIGMEADDRK